MATFPMRILYCGVASKFIHTMPAGWFLCEYLKEKGIPCEELYCNINEPIAKAAQEIEERNPDWLLLSVYIFNVVFVKELIAFIRTSVPHCKIVAGGPEADETIDADHIVVGEGEEALYRLLTENSPKIIETAPIEDLNKLPTPYTKQRLAKSKGKMIYYESTRGCPFSCAYCMAGLTRRVRCFDLERVKEDLVNIVASGAEIIKFTDRTFNADAKRTNEILQFILDRFQGNAKVCFHFEVGGDLFSESTLELLSRMPQGLVQLEAGVQTLNKESLKAVNRIFCQEKFEKNMIRILAGGNIHLHLDLIAGLPLETPESFRVSFNGVYALKPHMLQLGFLKFLKRTPIRAHTDAVYGKEPPYEVISTATMRAEELAELKGIERVLDKLYNSGRFAHTLAYLEEFEPTPYALYLSLSRHLLPLGDWGEYAVQKALLSYQNGLPYIKEVLRLDYFCCNAVHKTPSILKRARTSSFAAFLKTLPKKEHPFYEEFAFLPQKGAGMYRVQFDYRCKNRVTGRYHYDILNEFGIYPQ
ncbi:MAG: DUF4080 domain-containing protein [Clostridia bacterium]|nr:DUF4080 domain-containing protein [Clostridia bacterium]